MEENPLTQIKNQKVKEILTAKNNQNMKFNFNVSSIAFSNSEKPNDICNSCNDVAQNQNFNQYKRKNNQPKKSQASE